MERKYHKISTQKEIEDSYKLSAIIREDGWIGKDTLIVNCSPDYSSIITQILCHTLSDLNSNELFDVINLEMPYPVMNQIWNKETAEYELYDKYLLKWISKYISKDYIYLFVDSGTLRGKNFSKLKSVLRNKLDDKNFMFASLYVQDDSIFTPDYYVEKFNFINQGGLLFEWENTLNPNWNY